MCSRLQGAEQGNVQLADPVSGALKIIVQHGFDAAFLDRFAVVDDDSSGCGRAASHGAQLVIPDVITDPGFEPHRDIAAASGFRAVQSTPLADGAGRVLGIVSTHYPRPCLCRLGTCGSSGVTQIWSGGSWLLESVRCHLADSPRRPAGR